MLGAVKLYNARLRRELLDSLEQKKFLTPEQRREFEQARKDDEERRKEKSKP